MNRILLLALAPLAIPAPVAAQAMDQSNMPGMQMPAPKKPAAKPTMRKPPTQRPLPAVPRASASTPARPAVAKPAPAVAGGADPHADHDMTTMPGMAMPGAPAASFRRVPGRKSAIVERRARAVFTGLCAAS